MEVISGEKIVKSYGKFKVLKGINLNVQDGEFVGIMGKSGSGKTTLLKILGLIESVTCENTKRRIRLRISGILFDG